MILRRWREPCRSSRHGRGTQYALFAAPLPDRGAGWGRRVAPWVWARPRAALAVGKTAWRARLAGFGGRRGPRRDADGDLGMVLRAQPCATTARCLAISGIRLLHGAAARAGGRGAGTGGRVRTPAASTGRRQTQMYDNHNSETVTMLLPIAAQTVPSHCAMWRTGTPPATVNSPTTTSTSAAAAAWIIAAQTARNAAAPNARANGLTRSHGSR